MPIGLVSLYVVYRLLPAIKHPESARNIDYIGAALFTAAIAPFLVGLTNRQSADWSDPWVGGLILVGLVFGVVFLWWERRAPDPIIPLSLFRNRTFTISVTAMFLAAFGFFSAVVFLPRWFQVVAGSSATESGYQLLPLLGALIISATLSGQIVARTGRYKLLIFSSLVTLVAGLWLLTNLHADTERPDPVDLDGRRRPGHRPVVRGLRADRSELRVDAGGRDRVEQPDLLPADRRHRGPDDRRHDLRQPADRGDPAPARGGRRAAAVRRPVPATGWQRRQPGPDRHRAISARASWPRCPNSSSSSWSR